MSKYTGKFISIEGVEGVGKTTVIECLSKFLQEKKIDVIFTREPGGTLLAEKIRNILLSSADEPVARETELLLMFASRVQHVKQIVIPALSSGKWVVSDRFVDASYAYQGGGRGIQLNHIEYLDKWLLENVTPDITLLLDAPYSVCQKRMRRRKVKDRIEQEPEDFFTRVRDAYLERMRLFPNRYRLIDASQSVSAVKSDIISVFASENVNKWFACV